MDDFSAVHDFRGLEICLGDRIAYPRRAGSELWMQHGVVNGILESGELNIMNQDNKQVRILRSDRVAVLGRN